MVYDMYPPAGASRAIQNSYRSARASKRLLEDVEADMLESWGKFHHVGVKARDTNVQGSELLEPPAPHTTEQAVPPTKVARSSPFGHV